MESDAAGGATGPLVLLDLDGKLTACPTSAVDAMLAGLNRSGGGKNVSLWNGAVRLRPMRNRRPAGGGRGRCSIVLSQALHQATGAYPGVEEFLQRLQQAGVPMVLITNKPRLFTLPLLESLGWLPYFAQVLCADDLAEQNPRRCRYCTPVSSNRWRPAQALMIGDSRNDMQAAQAAAVACAQSPMATTTVPTLRLRHRTGWWIICCSCWPERGAKIRPAGAGSDAPQILADQQIFPGNGHAGGIQLQQLLIQR